MGTRQPHGIPRTDGACPVCTTAGTATVASRLNCDFRLIILIFMIFLNHENHFNHIQITVQTNERGAPAHIIKNANYIKQINNMYL
jgi:hypothetical protein